MISEALILPALDTLVLERARGSDFVPSGDLPAWCEELAPDTIYKDRPFVVTDVFPFFDLFLPDAEAIWKKGAPRRLDSDGFTQILANGTEIHLVGTALSVDGKSLLLVTVNERLFQEERNVLQRARELRFTHDALAREIEQKEVLTHCVVHDLRNPLTAILAALGLLEQRALDPAEAKLVEVATRAAKRQDELIRDVLSTFAARHDTTPGPSLAEPPWSDIGSIVTQVASVLEPTARARGVTIETVLDVTTRAINGHRTPTGAITRSDGTVEVAADELRLFRVLGNFVENALRYSPVGGTICIRVDAEGSDIFVAVEDEGPGVPTELVPHLFKKFARARDGTPGTGLGLYFCRITVEGWGGRLGYERRDGGGSRFWFRLPKRRLAPPSD